MKMVMMFLAAVIIISCKNFPVEPNSKITFKELQGSWLWLKSSGGPKGLTVIPSVNHPLKLQIGSDSAYSYFEKDEYSSGGKFDIVKETSIFDGKSVWMMKTFNDSKKPDEVAFRQIEFRQDTLVLIDNQVLGYVKFFKRIR